MEGPSYGEFGLSLFFISCFKATNIPGIYFRLNEITRHFSDVVMQTNK